MEGFDDPGVFFSDNFAVDEVHENRVNLQHSKKKFKEFIRQFHEGNFNYKYRDTLKRNYNLGQYWLEINLEDLAAFDESLAEKIQKLPTEYLSVLEEAAKDVADELTAPRPEGEEKMEDIQVLLCSDAHPSSLRGMKPDIVSKLVKIPGIIVSASGIRSKATKIAIQCRSCKVTQVNIPIKPGLEGYTLPRKCSMEQAGRPKCPLDPFFIMPDKCHCVDFQVLKLQELPDHIPQGEMPRHLQIYCDRYLCDRVVPGNRVLILGIYSIKKVSKTGGKGAGREKALVGVRAPYIRVLGISVDGENTNIGTQPPVTSEEEDLFTRLAADPNLYERIAKSIAPSIFGAIDIKKAIACLLFGGSRKLMPDGLCRRGDINILMLGDPGTAKSQLLKFVERVAPIAVYTSGKGSSAAGLTASITVRQLEAVIRISEALAKMQLQPFATELHVNEALRLFQVSTLEAAMSGSLAGAEGFTSEEDHEMLSRIEKQLKNRFPIGHQVSEQNIVKDFLKQSFPERAIYKVIHTMIRRGELQHRLQRKMLYRLH